MIFGPRFYVLVFGIVGEFCEGHGELSLWGGGADDPVFAVAVVGCEPGGDGAFDVWEYEESGHDFFFSFLIRGGYMVTDRREALFCRRDQKMLFIARLWFSVWENIIGENDGLLDDSIMSNARDNGVSFSFLRIFCCDIR